MSESVETCILSPLVHVMDSMSTILIMNCLNSCQISTANNVLVHCSATVPFLTLSTSLAIARALMTVIDRLRSLAIYYIIYYHCGDCDEHGMVFKVMG